MGFFDSKSSSSSTYAPIDGGAQSQSADASNVQITGGKKSSANVTVTNNAVDFDAVNSAFELGTESVAGGYELAGGTVSEMATTAESALAANVVSLDKAISSVNSAASSIAANASSAVSGAFDVMKLEGERNDALMFNALNQAGESQRQTFSESAKLLQVNTESMAALAAGQQVESLSRQNLLKNIIDKIKWPVAVIGLGLFAVLGWKFKK